MANFYKFTGYLLDVGEEFRNFEEYLNYINDRKYGSSIEAANVECVEIQWHDNVDLNKIGCTIEQKDAYFSKQN